jgi:hypothetical protein
MKKFVFTTAVALVLATGAYAQNHHAGGGGGMGGGGMSGGARGPGAGGGFGAGAGAGFNARGGGPGLGAGTIGRGPTGGLYNYSQSRSGNANFGRNGERFTGRTQQRGNNFAASNQGRNTYNYAGRNQGREFNQRGKGGTAFRQGLASGNYFEHGRHFRFRRFWNGQWVFLNDWSGCTAWAWVHVAPGVWAWRPIDVCIG